MFNLSRTVSNLATYVYSMPSIVSEAKHFATDINWQISNIAMVIMGGISYTDVYPVEKFVRDARLGQIWTGTENVMRMLIQHEYYKELLSRGDQCRAIEQDATNTLDMNEFEKVYADDVQEKLNTRRRSNKQGNQRTLNFNR
jgi:acyl-CoA dehydrogenase